MGRPKKSVTKILDLSKYPMLKTNVSPRKKRDVRSIGKNEAQERRFGLKIQQLVNGTMHLNVLQLLNTEPNKRNILNAPKFHISIAIELRTPTVVRSLNRNATTFHTKIAKIFNEKNVFQNHGKTVKTTQYKNVQTSTKRHRDRSPNRYRFECAATTVQLIMKMKKTLVIPTFLISEPPTVMTLKMMLRLLHLANRKKRLILDFCNKKKMLKILLKKRLRKRKTSRKKYMMMLFHLVNSK